MRRRRRGRRLLAGLAFCALVSGRAAGQTPAIEAGGYVSLLGLAAPGADPWSPEDALQLRLNLGLRWGEGWALKAGLRAYAIYAPAVQTMPGYAASRFPAYNEVPAAGAWSPGGPVFVGVAADRLVIERSGPRIEVAVGRQRLNWAIASIWSSNDVFCRASPLDPSYPEKPGIDALRARWYPSPLSFLELVYAPASTWTDSGLGALCRFSVGSSDLQIGVGKIGYASRRKAAAEDQGFVCAGWSGRLGEMGAVAEGSFFFPPGTPGGIDSVSVAATVSADYLVPVVGILLRIEGHYTSRPLEADNGDAMLTASGLSADPFSLSGELSAYPLPWIRVAAGATWYVVAPSCTLEAGLSVSSRFNADLSLLWQSAWHEAAPSDRDWDHRLMVRLKWSF